MQSSSSSSSPSSPCRLVVLPKRHHSAGQTAAVSAHFRRPNSTIHWLPMDRAEAPMGEQEGPNGLIAVLQRALCGHSLPWSLFFGHGQRYYCRGQYQTVLSREERDGDSGLELDQMEKERDQKEEEEEGEGETLLDQQKEGTERRRRQGRRAKQQKNRPSLTRLLLGSLWPSLTRSSSLSPPPSPSSSSPRGSADSMFDSGIQQQQSALMSPLSFPDFAGQLHQNLSIAQLSRSNALLLQENQRLANRVQELEQTLQDHVAHLNSVYFTLHRKHGFDALQLPDGELVRLSQLNGSECVLLTFVTVDKVSPRQQNQQQQTTTARRRSRLEHQAVQCHSPSISGGSSCSFVSASTTDSAAPDPVDLKLKMFQQLCIRQNLDQEDREQVEAYLEWLKSAGIAAEQEQLETAEAAKQWRAQQIQAQVQQSAENGNARTTARVHFSVDQGQAGQLLPAVDSRRRASNGWRNAQSEPAANGTPLDQREQFPKRASGVRSEGAINKIADDGVIRPLSPSKIGRNHRISFRTELPSGHHQPRRSIAGGLALSSSLGSCEDSGRSPRRGTGIGPLACRPPGAGRASMDHRNSRHLL